MNSSRIFSNFLRCTGLFIVGAGGMHVLLGLQADLLLGANVSLQTQVDPGLDSQNRFYGACFMLHGILLWIAAGDLERFAPVVRALLWVMLAAGLVRFISVWKFGWPPPLVGLLFALELALPPAVLYWFSRVIGRLVDSET